MTSPASAHADFEYEEDRKRRKSRMDRQHDMLVEMVRGPGFGPTDRDALWEEREIHDHLEAALRLLELARR